jgi:hypothetical protein
MDISFHRYINNTIVPPESVCNLQGYYANSYSISNSVFKLLGSFWQEYYKDINVLNTEYIAETSIISDKLNELYRSILASSIVNIPVEYKNYYKYIIFDSELATYVCNDGSRYSYDTYVYQKELSYIEYPIDCSNKLTIKYLCNYLLNPSVIIEESIDYIVDIINNKIVFYVDIFNDQAITDNTYVTYNYIPGTTRKNHIYILLWGIDVVLNEYNIYNKYGTYLYNKEVDSNDYKLLILALQFFFTNIKSIFNIETAINILAGVPFCNVDYEIVTEIKDNSDKVSPRKIITDKQVYNVPFYTEPIVQVGDVLHIGQLLCKWVYAYDYVTTPNWYSSQKVPYQLIDSWCNRVIDDDSVYYDGSTLYSGGYKYTQVYPDNSDSLSMPIKVFDGTLLYDSEYTYGPYKYFNNLISTNWLSGVRFPTWLFTEFDHEIYEYDFDNDSERALVPQENSLTYINNWYRANKYSNYPEEQWLYQVIHNILKYNLFYIRVILTLYSYQYYTTNIRELLNSLKSGFPCYVNYVLDILFNPIIYESKSVGEDYLNKFSADMLMSEVAQNPGTYFYDGVYSYDNSINYDIPGPLACHEVAPVVGGLSVSEDAVSYSGVDPETYIMYNGSGFYNGHYYYIYTLASHEEIEYISSGTVDVAEEILSPENNYYTGGYLYNSAMAYSSLNEIIIDTDFILDVIYLGS